MNVLKKLVKELYVEPKNEEILWTFVLLNSQDASFKENLVHKSGQSTTAARAGTSKKKVKQVKSRDIRDLFKRGGNEYTQQKRIEKRKYMEVINID